MGAVRACYSKVLSNRGLYLSAVEVLIEDINVLGDELPNSLLSMKIKECTALHTSLWELYAPVTPKWSVVGGYNLMVFNY